LESNPRTHALGVLRLLSPRSGEETLDPRTWTPFYNVCPFFPLLGRLWYFFFLGLISREQRIVGDTEGRNKGATRSSASRHRRRIRESRRLEARSLAKPEDAERGETRELHLQASHGGVRKRGNSRNHLNQRRGRCEIRGDSKIHCRHSEWTEAAGQPAISSPARSAHAQYGETRKCTAGLAGGSRGRGNSEPDQEAERGDA
jgi:hypothetical protein